MGYRPKHAQRMTITKRTSWLLAAAGVASAGILTLGTSSAYASSGGCAFGNGCATLHGQDAAGHDVAMDAKYQKKNEILIGYPDLNNDTATSFDGVLHFTKGPKTQGWVDTSLEANPPFFTPDITLNKPSTTNSTATAAVSVTGAAVSPKTFGTDINGLSANITGNTLTVNLNGTGPGDGTYKFIVSWVPNPAHNATEKAVFLVQVSGGNIVQVAADSVNLNAPPNTVYPNVQFSGTETCTVATPIVLSAAIVGKTVPLPTLCPTQSVSSWTGTDLPGGLSIGAGTGLLAPGTAVADTYDWATVSGADSLGATGSQTVNLKVQGSFVTNPGPDVPYYTFVFAPHGTWTNMCVTDINGSGALKLETCTLGHDRYQDFFALDGSGNPSQIVDGSTQYHFQDWLANIANPGHSCLIDHSVLNPGTPQSDPTDMAPGGRQLRVDGTCTASSTLWNWNT